MAQAKPITDVLQSLPTVPNSDPFPKKKSLKTRKPTDVIDNREASAPALKPAKEYSSPPTLPEPSSYNPNTSYSTSLINMLESIHSVGITQKDTAFSIIKSVEKTITEQYRKCVDIAIEEDKHANRSNMCDYFRKIAVCLFAAFSIVIGGNILSDSPLAGGAMIGSGITTLLGNLMVDSNANPQASAVLTALSAGFGLIAGITLSPDAISSVASQVAMAALAIASTSGELGKQVSHYQIEVLKANQSTLQELISRCRNIAEVQGMNQDEIHKATISTFTSASESIQALERAKQVIIANMITANAV